MLSEIERFPMVIAPGINNSGPDHWQTFWEASHPDARRTAPASFDLLDLDEWVRALAEAIADCATPPLIAAHSGGCLATLEWAARVDPRGRVAAILLVAPPDPSGPSFPEGAPSFRSVRPTPLHVPAAVVGSSTDPYDPFDYAAAVAEGSGAVLHAIGDFGHINAETMLGEWPEGQRILADLISSL